MKTLALSHKVVVGGVVVDSLSAIEWVDLLVSDWRRQGSTKIVTTANGQVLSLAAQNPAYRDALKRADHIAADGMSVVNGSRWFTQTALPERVSTTDWFHDAARAASQHGLSFYFLGADTATITQAVQRIRESYPNLRIAGWRDGYFNEDALSQIAQKINESGADVVWLGVGNPKQVLLAHKLRPLLRKVTWIRTCGGLFDFLAQRHRRAPMLLQRLGFEWAWRAMLEPRRLLWRYVTTNFHSAYLIASRSRTL